MVVKFEILPVFCTSAPALSSKNKKKSHLLQQVNKAFLEQLNPSQVEVEIRLDLVAPKQYESESELDEMWSYVAKKENQRWLWHAIDHRSGLVLAYFFGNRNEVFLQLKALLEPFGITRFYTDGWEAYERNLESDKHIFVKQNTQKIEKHI